MIQCVIIDDERPSIKQLTRYIESVPQLTLVGSTTSPIEGIEMITRLRPDVAFLDIQMAEMSGMEVARLTRGICRVIFCTAYAEFAVESYTLDAVDYLKKPIEFDRFEYAIKKLAGLLSLPFFPSSNNKKNYQFIKDKGKMVKLDFEDIDYIMSVGNYVNFYYGGQVATGYYNFKEVEDFLPMDDFCRVHKSFIIPLNKISHIEGRDIHLSTSTKIIPLGDHYRRTFFLKIKGSPNN
ncbi:MAG: response regulator transcription factor [Terrimonas sp.]|nr:response regulator transcription factor [Terrimonas sp.]OJY97949.1 MAG: hypothetical protein BGP13_09800 [Sphingobacteriales bacterium 40-81]